jgi:DNA-binding transcriptional LysR family regulator
MIDLVALRSLMALDAHGTVSAAAVSLGYTPSAVSQQIKRMERDLGVVLLDRVGRGVVLTDQGRHLVGHGHEILHHLEAAASGLQPGDALRGTVRVAAFSSSVRGLFAPLVTDLARTSADVRLLLFEQDPPQAVELLVAGQVDLAVVHSWVGVPLRRPENLEGVRLVEDVADVLVHRDHPLAARSSVTPGELLDEPWAVTPVGTICHRWFTHMFAGVGRSPQVHYWSGEFASHVRLVAEGAAVALVPRLGRDTLPPTVRALPIVDPVPTRVVEVLWRGSMSASAALRHVVGRLESIAAARSAG